MVAYILSDEWILRAVFDLYAGALRHHVLPPDLAITKNATPNPLLLLRLFGFLLRLGASR